MTLSNKKKKIRKKYRIFRGLRDIKRCEKCGKRLDSEAHHFLCNSCWKKDKAKKNKEKMKKIKLKRIKRK